MITQYDEIYIKIKCLPAIRASLTCTTVLSEMTGMLFRGSAAVAAGSTILCLYFIDTQLCCIQWTRVWGRGWSPRTPPLKLVIIDLMTRLAASHSTFDRTNHWFESEAGRLALRLWHLVMHKFDVRECMFCRCNRVRSQKSKLYWVKFRLQKLFNDVS